MEDFVGRRALTIILLFTCAAFGPTGALAQQAVGEKAIVEDENGYNMAIGGFNLPTFEIKLGEAHYQIRYKGYFWGWTNSLNYQLSLNDYNGNYYVQVTLGAIAKSFKCVNNICEMTLNDNFTPEIADGASLVSTLKPNGGADFTYTDRDGTTILFSDVPYLAYGGGESPASSTTITRPDGEKITIMPSASATSSRGYYIRATGVSMYGVSDTASVAIINGSVDYCDIASNVCPNVTQSWPTLNATQVRPGPAPFPIRTTFSEQSGRTSEIYETYAPICCQYDESFSVNGTLIEKIGPQGLSAPYNFQKNGSNWIYSNSNSVNNVGTPSYSDLAFTRTNQSGNAVSWKVFGYLAQVKSVTDELGRTRRYLFDSGNRLEYIVEPEGALDASGNPASGYTRFIHDARGNTTQTVQAPKAGSGLANIVKTAGFDATCSNPKTCNQPNWTRDAKGSQTDYTYAAAHGGLLSEMKPAPSAGSARPLLLKAYAQRSAWLKNAYGSMVQSPDPMWLIASETVCQTAAGSNSPTCDATAQQTVTTYEYGASGTAEALLVKGVAVTSNGVTLRKCFRYDIYQNQISETAPNANLGACP